MIYLYVKRHTVTGLKYFGKTYHYDPYKYKGSGKYWKSHIQKHGSEHIETVQVWQFDSPEECSKFAIEFSVSNNIVESADWANLINENGFDGAVGVKYFLGRKHSQETKNKMSATRKQIHATKGDWMSGPSNPNYGKKHSEEARRKMSANRPRGPSGKKWFNNGIKETFDLPVNKPEGYVFGRLKRLSYSS